MRAFAAVSVIAVAMLGACSLVVSTDGLSGAAPVSGADAAGDAAPPGLGDASTDGAGDAAADGAITPFCSSTALFCDDFERDGATGNGWSNGTMVPSISTAQSFSPTRSLAIALDAAGNWNWLQRTFTPPSQLAISFALFAKTPATTMYEMVKVPYGPNNRWETFILSLTDDGLHAYTQVYDNSPTPTPLNDGVAMGPGALYGTGWHRIRAVIDIRANPRTFDVFVDGKLGLSLKLQALSDPPTTAAVLMGVTYAQPVPYDGAFIDDFALAPP